MSQFPIDPDLGAVSGQTPRALLVEDRPCIYCSYNLRGLAAEGLCPECGKPVLDSLRGLLLQYSSPGYRDAVRTGLSLILNGILLLIVFTIVNVGVAYASMAPAWAGLSLVSLGLSLIPTIMLIVGYYRYTTPDPGYSGSEHPDRARKVARIAVVSGASAQAVDFLLTLGLFGLVASQAAPPGSAAANTQLIVALVAMGAKLAHFAAFVVQFFAIMLYTRWMARRVPDVYIEKRCRTYLWLLPLIAVVGLALLFLGPLIALVMYWNLLDRLRKHFKAIAVSGEPADLPKRLG